MPEIPKGHRRIFPSGTRCFRVLLNRKPERFLKFRELQFKSFILLSEELNLPHLLNKKFWEVGMASHPLSMWWVPQELFTVKFSKWPTWRTIILFYNTFITVLYMFRETSRSSSGGQILLIQHLVSSLSVSGRPVHRLRENCKFSLNLCTGGPLTESDDTRCCINTIWPPDNEHDVPRNVQRTVINVL